MPRSPTFVKKVLTMGGAPSREAAFAFLRLLRMSLIRVSATECEVDEHLVVQQTMCFEMDASDDEIGGCTTCTPDVMRLMTNNAMGGLPAEAIIKGVTDNYTYNKDNVSDALSIWGQLSIVGFNHLGNCLLV
jgi:hypothetical protein